MTIKSLRTGWRMDRFQTHEKPDENLKTSAMDTSMKYVKRPE